MLGSLSLCFSYKGGIWNGQKMSFELWDSLCLKGFNCDNRLLPEPMALRFLLNLVMNPLLPLALPNRRGSLVFIDLHHPSQPSQHWPLAPTLQELMLVKLAGFWSLHECI